MDEKKGIAWALAEVLGGGRVTRACWREAYLWVTFIKVEGQAEALPVILLKAPGGQGPWEPTQGDLLATDWLEVEK